MYLYFTIYIYRYLIAHRIRSNFLYFFFISVFIIPTPANAQYPNIQFDYFNTSNGLSQNTGCTITQDLDGFIWIGTQDGMNRFDGRTFSNGNNGIYGSNTNHQNHILHAFVDRQNRICSSSYGGGFLIFDKTTHKISNFNLGLKRSEAFDEAGISTVNKAFQDNQGQYWLASDNGLILLNPYLTNSKLLLKGICIADIMDLDSNHIVIISQKKGLFKINIHSAKSTAIVDVPFTKINANCEIKTGFCRLRNGNRLIFYKSDIYKLKTKENSMELEPLPIKKNNMSYTFEYPISTIAEDSNDNLWIGTNGYGVIVLKKSQENGSYTISDVSKINGLFGKIIFSIFKDKDNSIWVGHERGVQVYHREKSFIKKYLFDPIDPSINLRMVFSILPLENQKILVGTDHGIFEVDESNNKIKILVNKQNDACRVIYKDKKGNIWAGFDQGLEVKLVNTTGFKKASHIYPELAALAHGSISAILEKSPEYFILGGYAQGGGLYFWDKSKKSLKRYFTNRNNTHSLPSNDISSLLIDRDSILWIGTENGFAKYNPESDDFTMWKPKIGASSGLNCPYIYTIQRHNDELWMATYGGGLISYNIKDGKINNYTTQNGISNNTLYAALFTNDEKIWCSHNKGVSLFDVKTKTFTNFKKEDGLQDDEFNHFAYAQNPEKNLVYFGGVMGFNTLSNNIEKSNRTPPNSKIIEVKLNLHSQEKSLNLYEPIILKNYENSLSFIFASLNFISPKKNKFRTKLEEWDKEWLELGESNQVNYSNLPPGEYTLKMQSSNNENLWNEKGDSIHFKIIPSFYQTWWFKVGSVGIILGILFFGIVSEFRRKDQKRIDNLLKENELQKLRLSISQDIHDEIGSDLTKINYLSNKGSESVDSKETKKTYDSINHYSQNIMNQLNDIVFSLNPDNDEYSDLSGYIREVLSKFSENFCLKSDVSILPHDVPISIPPNIKKHTISIIKEALNNIQKHSKASKITFYMHVANDNVLCINIMDNGVGFDSNNVRNYANGIKNMNKRIIEMGGKIELETAVGKGTKIEFEIPLVRSGKQNTT